MLIRLLRPCRRINNDQVIQGVYPGVTTIELDELAAQTSAYMATQHPDFSKLAARISVSNLHKQTEKVCVRVCLCVHVAIYRHVFCVHMWLFQVD